MYFRKSTLKKYDLQESYNNFKIKLKISFVNRAPGLYLEHWDIYTVCRIVNRSETKSVMMGNGWSRMMKKDG